MSPRARPGISSPPPARLTGLPSDRDGKARPVRPGKFNDPERTGFPARLNPSRRVSSDLNPLASQRSLGEAAQERVREVLAGHPDARVHGDDAVRADDHRVEVKLGDLGQVVGEPGDAKQGVTQRTGVGRLLQQGRRRADGADQVLGVGVG